MRLTWPSVILLAVSLALGGCLTTTTDPARLPAGQWRLDPAHTSVVWRVSHFGLSDYTGRFDVTEAQLDFDPNRPGEARLDARIAAASVSTGDADFDADLAANWFDAETHPWIRFTAERVDITGENFGQVSGLLTLRGRTRPAVIETRFNGGLANPLTGQDMIGFSADLVIDRSEFGVGNVPPPIVGREVRIHIESEFVREDGHAR
ncbi:YceI family protein [Maricaulis sp. CAU 1757]